MVEREDANGRTESFGQIEDDERFVVTCDNTYESGISVERK
jgi:hypothetical protein